LDTAPLSLLIVFRFAIFMAYPSNCVEAGLCLSTLS
jgi:hypothetical protein